MDDRFFSQGEDYLCTKILCDFNYDDRYQKHICNIYLGHIGGIICQYDITQFINPEEILHSNKVRERLNYNPYRMMKVKFIL